MNQTCRNILLFPFRLSWNILIISLTIWITLALGLFYFDHPFLVVLLIIIAPDLSFLLFTLLTITLIVPLWDN